MFNHKAFSPGKIVSTSNAFVELTEEEQEDISNTKEKTDKKEKHFKEEKK